MSRDESKRRTLGERVIPSLFVGVLLTLLILAMGGLLLILAWVTLINPQH